MNSRACIKKLIINWYAKKGHMKESFKMLILHQKKAEIVANIVDINILITLNVNGANIIKRYILAN